MIQVGSPSPAGSVCVDGGVNFALYSAGADEVELCLFDRHGDESRGLFLPECTDGVWHGFLPGCAAGQRYGYRVHGPWSPADGLRFNAAKLLIDPYARRLDGTFGWSPAVFDFEPEEPAGHWRRNEADSAPFIPRSVVTPSLAAKTWKRPAIPWSETIIYEANVRGFTMRHLEVPEPDRGRFRGMSNGRILEYLKSLGITSLELMPVHAFCDEQLLVRRGLRNLWGYNSFQFFVPDARFGREDAIGEFREMVDAIHDAGIEVILDVAYNHTGESDEYGPMLSFRGIDNLSYYRTEPGEPGRYVNDTGCGNTINANHPRVQSLVLESLRYWRREMGVDGFRFDLAAILGRRANGFDPGHPLLRGIGEDPELGRVKLIAEPWDPGPGGYQLGRFPAPWAEWNDRYRNAMRRTWRGDPGQMGEFARRIHGSSDLFEHGGGAEPRPPHASVNYVACHDGFTLRDLVSYGSKHNEANGQNNRDGQSENFSCNHGVEGETADDRVNLARSRHRLNLLATLLFSQGTPMILAGDEFGNTQDGNNNAYAQDNGTGWLNWALAHSNRAFTDGFRELVGLRRELALLRQDTWLHGPTRCEGGWRNIRWLRPDGEPMQSWDWDAARQLTLLLSLHGGDDAGNPPEQAVAVSINTAAGQTEFRYPNVAPHRSWRLRFCSAGKPVGHSEAGHWVLPGFSISLFADSGCGRSGDGPQCKDIDSPATGMEE